MPAVLRYLLIALAGLVLLGGVAVAGILFLFDPNDFKPQIEEAAETHTRLDLQLGGDIGWSFIPLGLELNAVKARLDDQPFLELEQLIARVSLRSLIQMQPSVHRFELAGLDLNLILDKEGRGNWERIMPEQAEPSPKTAPKEEPAQQDSGALLFNISEVDIRNTRVHYRDENTGQTVTLDEFGLQASNIKPQQAFPLDLQFHLATTEPALDIRTKLNARLTLGEQFKRILLDQLSSQITLQGDATNQKSVDIALDGNIDADLNNSRISLSALKLALNKVQLNTDLVISQFDSQPQLAGTLAVAEFSPRELLSQLGQSLPPMQDPNTLRKLSFDATLGGAPGQIELKPLKATLDDSKLSGEVRYTLDNGALFTRLNLDAINADRYLAPAEETPAEESQAANTQAAPETDLLPLETLRSLQLDTGLNIGELIINAIPIRQLAVNATATDGLVTVNPLSGQLYEGSFKANASIDARNQTPRWQVQAKVSDVKTLPLLTQLAEMQQFSGLANIDLDLNTTGNRVSTLRNNAKGQANFAIKQGKFEGTSMSAYACEGIALMHKESIDTSTWPKVTDFEDLSGAVTINGNAINNSALTAQLKGMALEGKGAIDIASMDLDYRAGLRILGDIHENPSCRVNEKLKGLIIPVKCKGSLTGEKGLPCKFDTARFREVLADKAKAEAKEKASEEIDRGREKLKEKARDKLQNLFGR
ncbi:MAG: AsmA family protein [Spongiibacteraceae bacterium]|jgi:AsmA protein|nr:AsmA family protein [Spongiibacteraceae bacterium]